MQAGEPAEVAGRPTAGAVQKTLLWWALGWLLAGFAALPFDQAVTSSLSSGGPWHDISYRSINVLLLVGGAILVAAFIAHVPRPRNRVIALGLVPVAMAVGLTVTLMLEDRAETLRRVLEPLVGWTWVGIVLSTYYAPLRMAVGLIVPQVLAALVTHAGKLFIGRARPLNDLGSWHFVPLARVQDHGGDFESLPSGHSSATAALVLTLAYYFPRWRWALYFAGGIVGLERIIADKHWLSDVCWGFAVGVAMVYLSARLLGPQAYQPVSADAPPGTASKGTSD